MELKIAKTDKEITGCYGVMSQLRPHIKKEEFLGRVREQGKYGYNLAFLEDGGQVVCTAGFRYHITLAWGKLMYVDDLVTDEARRSKGYGDKMIDRLEELAKENGCEGFHLDSAVHRFSAHRFYFRKRMAITCYHFEKEL